MPVLKDTEVFSSLKSGDVKNLYFLYGPEQYFILRAVERIIEKAVPGESAGLNLTRLEGEKLSLDSLEDLLESVPFFAQKKCVAVKDLEIEKFSKEEQERFCRILADLPDSAVLLFYQIQSEPDLKKAKTKKILELITKNGIVCRFEQKDKRTLKRALCDRAAKAGLSMDPWTAEALIDRCGSNYGVLIHEMDKLIGYAAGQGEITERHVLESAIPTLEASAFDWAKSILLNRFDRAFLLLDELFAARQEPVKVLSALCLAFADLHRAKCAVISGRSPEQVGADFKYPRNRMFAVKNAFRDVPRFSVPQLHACMEALYQADLQLKSSKLESRAVLEQMLFKMRLAFSVNN